MTYDMIRLKFHIAAFFDADALFDFAGPVRAVGVSRGVTSSLKLTAPWGVIHVCVGYQNM